MAIDANVLVVDDDPLNRQLLKQALVNEGCRVETVEDGMRALRALRTGETQFDLLLLDVMMPGMDGYEVLSFVKDEPTLARIPVIMISALDDLASVVKCLELGADDYLTKPFNPVLLRARINNSLARKRHADAERRYLQLVEQEERRSDLLIRNILPIDIAQRLKDGETGIADQVEDMSVLFADLVGFSAIAARQSATETVAMLNEVVTTFDRLAVGYGIEKIKTIGDAYLAVGGLGGSKGDNHVLAAVQMALDMVPLVAGVNAELQLRVGIHVGPAVAGIIGTHKFSFDVWGDTVNIASRMESHGKPGRVHVSDTVRDRLDGILTFEDRGAIDLKNRGTRHTYFVTSEQAPTGLARAADTMQLDWATPEELLRGRFELGSGRP
jgi:adenylate cyclase